MLLIDGERALRIKLGKKSLSECVLRGLKQTHECCCQLRVGALSSERPREWGLEGFSGSCSA